MSAQGIKIGDISLKKLSLFSEIICKLDRASDGVDVRRLVLEDIIHLLDVDIALSCVWNPNSRKFVSPHLYGMDSGNFQKYESYYQFNDPHTFQLRALKRVARVEEVMPYEVLFKTEFYNDFLKNDQLHHGINLFLFDGEKDLGDFRLWRRINSPQFEDGELLLLTALQPYLMKALIRNDLTKDDLTKREREVASLVARGCRDKDIAGLLGISFSTVRTHMNRAMEKKGCSNRAELAAIATKAVNAYAS